MAMILAAVAAAATPTVCNESCGNLTIPYPFGTRKGCYRDEYFHISCKDSTPFLKGGNLQVLDISLHGEFRISSWVAYDCYKQLVRNGYDDRSLWLFNYSISYKRNKFMAIGCDTCGYLRGYTKQKSITNCMAYCNTMDDVIDGFCSGVGCCETQNPMGVLDYNLSVRSYNSHNGILDINPCGFALIVEEGEYNFSKVHLYNLSDIEKMPMVVDWAIEIQRKNMRIKTQFNNSLMSITFNL
ncbi:wall-associated receptor kinase 2-like [Cornus florida]|uniref:wall-associated receptor kinase 2-like n=1 Tax=Cornus florida TaxID=4283 RepID=UPI0028984E15|nr:wall-associated receptor kinase 2-like [Cornus florida]